MREAAPIYGIKILPDSLGDWQMIAVDQLLVPEKADWLRAQLLETTSRSRRFKDGTRPFPDGAIIARDPLDARSVGRQRPRPLASSEFPGAQSLLVGSQVNVQFMVKASKKYAATAGWGFADRLHRRQTGQRGVAHQTCFPCHGPAKDRDYVFTHYAP